MNKVYFYKCNKCGKVKCVIGENVSNIECCDEKMELLKPNTTDGATEKHVPVYEVNGKTVKVKVGEVEHPMTKEHHIKYIVFVGENADIRTLEANDKPEAEFVAEKEFEIYAYCNLHGLWKNECKK